MATLTAAEIEAVEAWRTAERRRCEAVMRYNAYLNLVLNAGGHYLPDNSFYRQVQDAERSVRVAAQALSVALGCQQGA